MDRQARVLVTPRELATIVQRALVGIERVLNDVSVLFDVLLCYNSVQH